MRKIRQKCWTTQNVGFLMQALKWRSSKCLVVRGGVSTLWLRVTDVVWSSECEGVRQRQSLTQHSASQPTDWFSTARAARQQPITHKVLWLFVLHTKKMARAHHRGLWRRAANKGISRLSHLFRCKEGAVRGVCVHWLADWETGMAGESVDCTSCILTRYKYFWVNLLQITSSTRPLLPSARGRQQSNPEWVVTANLPAGMTK